jgi:bifunctional UDP-N-acetylglucosamine pyrophosphorylase/glucosamine-1-phosphate N-acetyltransferase
MRLGVVILAAGQGKRMKSDRPKVLHELAGRSLLGRVIDTARLLQPAEIVVVHGHGGEQVRAEFSDAQDLRWAEQAQQLGTGHAVQQAVDRLDAAARVLILYGDVPLVRAETLAALITAAGPQGFGLLTVRRADPTGYGRVVRDAGGRVQRIVEQKDADAEQLLIDEVNTGIMVLPRDALQRWLGGLSNDNAQREYYLTDVIEMAVAEGFDIEVCQPESALEAEGVNDRVQLAAMERAHQNEVAEHLMREGVTLFDPARFDLRGSLSHGRDVEIDVNVVLAGAVKLGDRVQIGPNCVLRDVTLGDDVEILANSVIEGALVGPGSRVGPFARLRPGAALAVDTHIGNFVEVKQSTIGPGSKVNHLSYIGDADIGRGVNVGAGTITCNYDGAKKHKTVIGDHAFVGSNTALVAPVAVGDNATIGAGSVISRDAPADQLTVSRARQASFDWQRPTKDKRS